ncbi:MAG TPA: hypothetical protein VKY90_04515 [Candidatus Dormibacteraeota bacterium]|nr:hypothetical protein [Candidatus Dormibacteraeota bacterium]
MRDRSPWHDGTLRRKAQELTPVVHGWRRRWVACHEAGHFLVAVYLGHLPTSIGIDVGTLMRSGLVRTNPRTRPLSPTAWGAVIMAGGLAQRRLGVPETLGTEQDREQLEALGLTSSGRRRACRIAEHVLDRVWPDVELLAEAVAEHTVLAGETALAYLLAVQAPGAEALRAISSGDLVGSYVALVDARHEPRSRARTPSSERVET